MRKFLCILFIILINNGIYAQSDSLSVNTNQPKEVKERGFKKFLSNFTRIDSSYIEPQQFNFAFMLQNTNTYKLYRLKSDKNQSVTLAPNPSIRVGPFFGWRWIFLGYTFDISHLNDNSGKQEFNLSLYSAQVGIDLFYKKTGNDYKIKYIDLGNSISTKNINNLEFNGFKASIKGFNLYYIFNHHKFSYPAAFSQSTIQRKSAGSMLMGIGLTVHSVCGDWDNLENLLKVKLNITNQSILDSSIRFERIKYTDISLSCGYAYNWAFARNWLLAGSLSLAVGYKHSKGNTNNTLGTNTSFSLQNFNLDGIGRFGLVWNNMRWYAGASAILHEYNYRKKQFSTNNIFGTLNIYAGVNFGRKK